MALLSKIWGPQPLFHALIVIYCKETESAGLAYGALILNQGVDFDPIPDNWNEKWVSEDNFKFNVESDKVTEDADDLSDPTMVTWWEDELLLGQEETTELQQENACFWCYRGLLLYSLEQRDQLAGILVSVLHLESPDQDLEQFTTHEAVQGSFLAPFDQNVEDPGYIMGGLVLYLKVLDQELNPPALQQLVHGQLGLYLQNEK